MLVKFLARQLLFPVVIEAYLFFFFFLLSENITNADDEPSKYLNSNANNSNASPELIEYYDVDDVSSAPDPIFPDPESLFHQNSPENVRIFDEMDATPKAYGKSFSKSGATKFNKLQELSNPINGFDENAKRAGVVSTVDGITPTVTMMTVTSELEAAAVPAAAAPNAKSVDTTFKGKSIDFNIRHTMEELRNEDLRDHDIIDNIMYIYYGSNVALRKSLGGSIIIVGTVFALAAQILAIIFTLLRNRWVNGFYLFFYFMSS